MTTDPIPLRAGQSLGRYELLAPIAKGGMGQVWAGRLRGARGFQKLVAIKTLLPALEDSERMERMLFEEARIAGLIQHANVVQTMELGEHQGALYLVMEWVDGEPLSYLVKSCEAQGLPLSVAVNFIGQTLRGLQAAHELRDDTGKSLGVVHRDVSPHNVLVSYTGVAKLVDFGIAKAMNQESSSTTTGEIKGKFSYMAPEQILGLDVDQRADLFSLGIMLYLMTAGQHPFKNHEAAGVLHSITSAQPAPRPSLSNPSYSLALEAVVMKALEKDRDRRWASAAEMRAALQQAMPEAFAIGMEGQVEAFMVKTVGERAAHKREALRRAELRRDRNSSSSGSLAAASASAQSASSLRAVSVDAIVSVDEEPSQRPSGAPTELPPAEASSTFRRPRVWTVAGVAAAALFAFTALARHGVSPSDNNRSHLAAAPLSSIAPLRRPASDPATLLSATAKVVTTAGALPTLPTLPTLGVSGEPAPGARRTKPPRTHVKHALGAQPIDLIAPDYAR